jgi:hypothetical protein
MFKRTQGWGVSFLWASLEGSYLLIVFHGGRAAKALSNNTTKDREWCGFLVLNRFRYNDILLVKELMQR